MQKITSIAELKSAIQELEHQQVNEWPALKEQFLYTYESMKPINIIKNTFSELTSSPDLKGDLLNTTLSLAAGYISKKIAVGSTHNPLKNLFGSLLQMGVTNLVSKNADGIKSTTMNIINSIFNKKDTPT
jgi:hypothetical protein